MSMRGGPWLKIKQVQSETPSVVFRVSDTRVLNRRKNVDAIPKANTSSAKEKQDQGAKDPARSVTWRLHGSNLKNWSY